MNWMVGRRVWWALILGLGAGCSKEPSVATDMQPAPGKTTSSSAEHSHGSGPHGGTVADWGGGKYHVEFTVNHDRQEATVYILGSDARSAAPVKAEKLLLSIADPRFQLDLLPKPRSGEPAGAASRFVGKHKNLGQVREFGGTISAEVDATPYAADFQEEG